MEYKLEDIFDLQMGKTPSRSNPEYWNSNDHKWISIGDLSRCGKYIEDTKEYLSDKAVEESGISIIPAGTVVMSFKLSIGKTAIIPEPMYSNEAIMSFRDKHVIDILPDYTYYMLSSRDWDTGTNKAVMGKTLNKATLSKIKVKVHGIAEQKEIVRVLDKLNAVIEARQMEIQKLEDLIKARFVEMFGDLADPACKWEKCRLVDACSNSDDIKCGPFGTQLGKDEYTEEGVSVWEIPQINSEFKTLPTHFVTEEKAAALNAYSIIPGDIAMSRKGNVGRCAVFPATFENGIIHSDVLRIRLDKAKVLPEFMMRQLHYSGDIQHQIELVSSGAIMAGINVTKLKQIYVYLPPIDLQGKFVEFIAQVDKSKAVIQKSLEEAQLLFDSLMQQYFG